MYCTVYSKVGVQGCKQVWRSQSDIYSNNFTCIECMCSCNYGMLLTIISETSMQHWVLEEELYSEWRAIFDQPAVDVNWRLSLSITLSAH